MRVDIRRLDYPQVLNYSTAIAAAPAEEMVTLDFSQLGFVKPFGAVWLIAALHGRKNVYAEFPQGDSDAMGYAAHVGLFDHLRFDVAKPHGTARGGLRYAPIVRLSAVDIMAQASARGISPQTIILEIAGALARVLVHDEWGDAFVGVRFAIKEILRNALEHGGRDATTWACAQYWEGSGLVEVAIADDGIGIQRHLASAYPTGDPRAAIDLALQPGVTGADRGPGSLNSGYGLYLTHRLCTEDGSYLIASSGQARHDGSWTTEWNETGLAGTGVRMELRLDALAGINERIDRIAREGEAEALRLGGGRISRASPNSGLYE